MRVYKGRGGGEAWFECAGLTTKQERGPMARAPKCMNAAARVSLSFFVVKTGLRPASLLVLLRLVVVVEASA